MGLYCSRRPAVCRAHPARISTPPPAWPQWWPDGSEPMTWPASAVEDADADAAAFSAGFILPCVPGASVTVWFYPARSGPGKWTVRWRWQHTRADGTAVWSRTGYAEFPNPISDLGAATTEAMDLATALATSPHELTGEGWGFLDWDGQPYDTTGGA